MANILDRYGIKEVADVTFYHINKDSGKPDYPVLFLDTLKVSTIEQTAESADATGGKGNAKLITWDYGKEITVTLEDALFSAKSMAIMFGNGAVASTTASLLKTIRFTASAAGTTGVPTTYKGPRGIEYTIDTTEATIYKADASASTDIVTPSEVTKDTQYFYTFKTSIKNGSKIAINADSFPDAYYVTGDTYARSEANNEDEFFQFIIYKAKVTSENTITLEAEGDPSVFNMNLTVLRPENGVMMELVKYDIADTKASNVAASDDGEGD